MYLTCRTVAHVLGGACPGLPSLSLSLVRLHFRRRSDRNLTLVVVLRPPPPSSLASITTAAVSVLYIRPEPLLKPPPLSCVVTIVVVCLRIGSPLIPRSSYRAHRALGPIVIVSSRREFLTESRPHPDPHLLRCASFLHTINHCHGSQKDRDQAYQGRQKPLSVCSVILTDGATANA